MVLSLLLVALLICSSFGQPSTSMWTQDQSGDGTYYGGNLQGGHCSIFPVPSFVSSNIVPVAMNKIDYANSAGCGQCVQIWGTGSGSGANAIPTTPFIGWVNDECPECLKGSIDLGKSGDGRWGIKWRAVDCPTGSETLSYMFQGSNPYYMKIQVRGHKIPVSSLQVANKGSSSFVTLQRQPDNFFTCPSGCTYPMVFPLQVKVTGLNGEVLVDAIPNLVQTNNQPLQGSNKVQFKGIGSGSTPPPTKPPTAPPTKPPTAPPTAPPTKPPTAPPTKPPTKPPTAPPTAPPTKPPTAPPPPTGGCQKPSSFSSSQAGSTLSRFDQFINTLTTMEGTVRAVHSSGGAAGGVVSEGQGYGLFIGGTTAAALGSSHADFARVVSRTYEMFLGWQKMCFLSTSDGCQNPRYCQNGANAVPCLPHWKFDDRLSGSQGTGSAPDGDEDAILGMILLLKATQGNKPSWWNSVADWTYRSSKQFYESSTAPQGAYRIVKLGACWGGWDCNNPSYHAPAAYKWMRDFMASYSTEGASYSSKWDVVISTSYSVLLADQCATTGLVTNWYVPNANPSVQGSTACSGSGTPAAEFGSEASRTMFRVVLDYIWTGDSRAAQFLQRAVPKIATKFNANQNLDTGCLVTSIHQGWLDNAFMYGPTLSTLVYPSSSVSGQQALVDKAGSKLASGGVNDYYSGSWVVISTMVLNGDLARVGAGCASPPPPPSAPTAPPTAPPTKPPTAPPPSSPVGTCQIAGANNNQYYTEVQSVTGATVKITCTGGQGPFTCTPSSWGDSTYYQCSLTGGCTNPSPSCSTPGNPTAPPTAPPTKPPTAPPTAPPTKPPTAPPTAPPTKPPTAPPTTGGSGGCTGIMYGSDPGNNWWFAISGNPSSGVTVKVECADPTNVVSCSFMGTWGDRYQCQASKECFNDRTAVITQNGATKRCPLDKNKINNARLEGEEDAPQSGLPGYAIGLIVAGCVLLGLLVVGAFLVSKMKKKIDPERV